MSISLDVGASILFFPWAGFIRCFAKVLFILALDDSLTHLFSLWFFNWVFIGFFKCCVYASMYIKKQYCHLKRIYDVCSFLSLSWFIWLLEFISVLSSVLFSFLIMELKFSSFTSNTCKVLFLDGSELHVFFLQFDFDFIFFLHVVINVINFHGQK